MITDTHPDYAWFLLQWQRCADAVAGSDAIKYRRETYLPRLPGQSDIEYAAYLLRAIWRNFSEHVVDLYSGLIFSKDVEIENIDAESPLVSDATLSGRPLSEVAESITEAVLSVGRYGILVDYAGYVDASMSMADAERIQNRAFLVEYPALDIINWHEGRHGGRYVLDRVVLHELVDGVEQYRELALIEGAYTVNLWRRSNRTDWAIAETMTPLLGGAPLPFIPFYFFDAEFGEPTPHKSPILEIVDMNLSHYRTMADLEHGRFFCGIPTPVFAGFQFDDGDTVKLGGLNGISSPDANAKAYYLEFTGEGLSALERAAIQKEQWISEVSGGLLDSDKPAAETATAIRLRKTGANATLASIASAISLKLTQVLSLMDLWTNGAATASPKVQLATEYLPSNVSPEEINALMSAVMAGNFRRVDFLRRLKAGNILPPTANVEDIDLELPDALTMAADEPETVA